MKGLRYGLKSSHSFSVDRIQQFRFWGEEEGYLRSVVGIGILRMAPFHLRA